MRTREKTITKHKNTNAKNKKRKEVFFNGAPVPLCGMTPTRHRQQQEKYSHRKNLTCLATFYFPYVTMMDSFY